MIADLVIFLFVIIICSFFGIVVCLIEDYSIRHKQKEQRKKERKQKQLERREFRSKVYESEITVALHRADVALNKK